MMRNLKVIIILFVLSLHVGILHSKQKYKYCKKNHVAHTEKNITELRGEATFYGNCYSKKRKTASGEYFYKDSLTAAHKTFKFGTKVKITNLKNGKSVIVKINDKCPQKNIIDLSPAAFDSIGSRKTGRLKVKMKVLR